MTHDDLLNAAKKAITRVAKDEQISADKRIDSLDALISHVEAEIGSIESPDEDEDGTDGDET